MVKIKQYALPVILAFSLLFNFMFFNQVNSMSTSLSSLRARMEQEVVTINIYNQNNLLLKTMQFEVEVPGLNLETHLAQLKAKGRLAIDIESTSIGAWVSSVLDLKPTDNQYWAVLSMTNGACKLAASNPENYAKVDGYCTKGISEIFVEYGDVFIFKILTY
jgi:hypothetical protein